MPVHNVNLQEAEGHLKELADLAVKGEDVLINLGGGRVMKLVIEGKKQAKRIAGLHQGQGWVSDDFDEPTDDLFGLGDES